MKADELLQQILLIIHEVKEDERELQKILDFLQDEIIIPDEEEKEVQLPEKYNAVVKEIAGSIDAGQVCFLNTNTLQIDKIPFQLHSDPWAYKMETGMRLKDFKPKYTRWKKYMTIEPLESHESYEIMEKFAEQLDNSGLKSQLVYALNNQKPFANFKRTIDNSEFRQDWFDFKDKQLQNYVRAMIEIEIQKKPD